MSLRPPSLEKLLERTQGPRPVAFVLAGHNGSGKSTLWYSRLAGSLQIPLINADRMMLSILPDADARTGRIPVWAQQLRDDDARWQVLSQEGVRVFKRLVMEKRMPFAFETVFSHWKPLPGGGHDVDRDKLIERFPRTQAAVGHAAEVADMTLMFDNSRSEKDAFSLVRAQARKKVLFDARDPQFRIEPSLSAACGPWLQNVAGPYGTRRRK